MARLGVNIDHIANIRQARQTFEPDPVSLAIFAELGGADSITIHLREDRRHIQDRDLRLLKETVHIGLNLEMAANKEMENIAKATLPDLVTLVPEKREEITTEGGLDVINNSELLNKTIKGLNHSGIPVSLFIDPIENQLIASKDIGAKYIELHTGTYAEALGKNKEFELSKIIKATEIGLGLGLQINAGHGLTYQNVEPIARINGIDELNIGHTIISRSIAVGLKEAVREMKDLIINPRKR
tara:strand:- start:610 stop:1335 length:726 start_codon:yes stop_codon:yes gene_type:complete